MPKEDGQFKPGNKLGGRTVGSRSKLGETFLQDVHQLWLNKGNQALQDMLDESPTKFCQMVAAILPRHIDIDSTDGVRWVINASPRMNEIEWRKMNNLPIESDT